MYYIRFANWDLGYTTLFCIKVEEEKEEDGKENYVRSVSGAINSQSQSQYSVDHPVLWTHQLLPFATICSV